MYNTDTIFFYNNDGPYIYFGRSNNGVNCIHLHFINPTLKIDYLKIGGIYIHPF